MTWTRRLAAWVATTAILVTAAVTLTAPPAAADVDVYITPGWHRINGRDWSTTCEKYSSTITRCRTNILATTVIRKNGRYVAIKDWVFNNLTYLGAPRAAWSTNTLAKTSYWKTADGRSWRTECDTAVTGRGGCRTYATADIVTSKLNSRGQRVYYTGKAWVFNNMVRFSSSTPTVTPTTPTTPAPSPSPTAPAGPYDARVGIDSQDVFAKSLVVWANKARVEAGPIVDHPNSGKPVPYDPSLNAEALRCAQSNVANGALDHSLPGCITGDGIYAENLAGSVLGQNEPASSLIQRWMNSPGHYVGIVGSYNLGFGGAYACDAKWCVAVLKIRDDTTTP